MVGTFDQVEYKKSILRHEHNLYCQSCKQNLYYNENARTHEQQQSPSQALYTWILQATESWLGNEVGMAVGIVQHNQTGETAIGYT